MLGAPVEIRRHPRCRGALELVLAISILGTAQASGASILRVPADFPSIQAAVDAAGNGDQILVAAGTYQENISFRGKAIGLASEAGPALTLIIGSGGTVVDIESVTGSASFKGFTVRGGAASFGGAFYLYQASPRISGNVITSNLQGSGGFGAAIGGFSASPEVDHNLFVENSCENREQGSVVAFVNSSSPLIHDNLFFNNSCRAIDMTLPEGNSPQVYNNTIVRNRVGIHIDHRVSNSFQSYRNNILVANDVGLQITFGEPPLDATWTRNLVFGNGINFVGTPDPAGTDGNLSADPLFVDFQANDFRLRRTSPAIDQGDATGLVLQALDVGGQPRITDGNGDGEPVIDLGAYEVSTSIPVEGIPVMSSPGRLLAIFLMGLAGIAILSRVVRC